LPAWGLIRCCGNFCSQNLGAQQAAAVRRMLLFGLHTIYGDFQLASVTGIYLLFASSLAGIFTDIPEIHAIASTGIAVNRLRLRIFCHWMVTYSAFNGAGDTRTPALN